MSLFRQRVMVRIEAQPPSELRRIVCSKFREHIEEWNVAGSMCRSLILMGTSRTMQLSMYRLCCGLATPLHMCFLSVSTCGFSILPLWPTTVILSSHDLKSIEVPIHVYKFKNISYELKSDAHLVRCSLSVAHEREISNFTLFPLEF